MKILHISDTHQYHELVKLDLHGVDVLIHSGDATNSHDPIQNLKELHLFLAWYADLGIKHKIYVPGNHDAYIYHNEEKAKKLFEEAGIIYLNKSSVTIQGFNFYGDAATPKFYDWYFMLHPQDLKTNWDLIPKNTDVLITHGPAYGMLDTVVQGTTQLVGCKHLYEKINELPRLKAHLFGHIHSGYWNLGVLEHLNIYFSNGACFTDAGLRGSPYYYGRTFTGNVINLKLV